MKKKNKRLIKLLVEEHTKNRSKIIYLEEEVKRLSLLIYNLRKNDKNCDL